MKKNFIILSAVLLLMNACTPNVDLVAEKAAVKDVLDKMEQAMTSEDMESFAAHVAHDSDMVNFGTDASERWVGWNALKSAVEQQFAAFKDFRMAVRDQVIKVGACGNVAWFSQVMDWNLEAGGEPVSLKSIRETGVLEKHDGKWLFVQMHFSLGVSGQAAAYSSSTQN
jgi:uncharacterized protein (TIGR02246 family)